VVAALLALVPDGPLSVPGHVNLAVPIGDSSDEDTILVAEREGGLGALGDAAGVPRRPVGLDALTGGGDPGDLENERLARFGELPEAVVGILLGLGIGGVVIARRVAAVRELAIVLLLESAVGQWR